MVGQYSSEQLPNINGWQMGFKHKHLPALSYQSLLVFSSFRAAREIETRKFLSTTGCWHNFCFTLHSRWSKWICYERNGKNRKTPALQSHQSQATSVWKTSKKYGIWSVNITKRFSFIGFHILNNIYDACFQL